MGKTELYNVHHKSIKAVKIQTTKTIKATTPTVVILHNTGFDIYSAINGFNIGRYYNDAGPQKTLYVPAPILKKGKNEILVFESDSTDRFSVEFLDKEDLGESAPITEQGGF